MVNTIYLLSFVETPRKFIIAELYYYCTDEDLSLRIESSAIINLRDVSTKLVTFVIFFQQVATSLQMKSCNQPVKLTTCNQPVCLSVFAN